LVKSPNGLKRLGNRVGLCRVGLYDQWRGGDNKKVAHSRGVRAAVCRISLCHLDNSIRRGALKKCDNFIRGNRTAQIVALVFVAIVLLQEVDVGVGFNAFGEYLESK